MSVSLFQCLFSYLQWYIIHICYTDVAHSLIRTIFIKLEIALQRDNPSTLSYVVIHLKRAINKGSKKSIFQYK